MNFFLTIATVTEKLFDGEVLSVTAPGSEGEVTILANHEPFVTTLKEGVVTVRVDKDSEPQEFTIQKGLLEVGENKAVVLV